MQFFSSLAAVFASASLVLADSTFSPARPPAIPLAVRSPYLNTWMQVGSDDGDGGYLAGRWPTHWSASPGGNGGVINAMAGIIRVDGKAYEFMGFPSQRTQGMQTVNQSAFNYTSTRSIFVQSAGPVEITTTFLSPVNPDDQKRESLVSSYVNVAVKSTDGQQHAVQLYTDISAEWCTGDATAIAQWTYGTTGNISYHMVSRQTPLEFTETPKKGGNLDKAEWGNWYWAGPSTHNQSYQSGMDTDVRGAFVSSGKLGNTNDTKFRAVGDSYPVMGLAYDLGQVGSDTVCSLFTMNLMQQNAILFEGIGGTHKITSLWTAYWPNEVDAVSFFHGDFQTASQQADGIDQKIQSDSEKAGGQDYATINTLSIRQAFAGTQLVGNLTKQYVFLKEISSDGNVNTADVIYPAMPAYLYMNATYFKLMLDPLFEQQEAGWYPNKTAIHDIGPGYPNATGHNDGQDEAMPLEESGNMLVMTYAYYIKSQDVSYLKEHYKLLKQWTDYLVEQAISQQPVPGSGAAGQLTTDDFAGPLTNSTNLAFKATIGIAAMGQIANLTGNTADATHYASTAADYINQLKTLAFDNPTNPTKALLTFGDQGSWLTLYNLYADKLLKTNIVPQSMFDVQDAWYKTKFEEFGLPLDSRNGVVNATKADWMMFAAAAAGQEVRTTMISLLAKWIGVGMSAVPFTDLYWCDHGDTTSQDFAARPVIGGTFALLAMQD